MKSIDYNKIAEYAWLNLGDVTKLNIHNPLLNRTEHDIEEPHIHILKLMRDPRYLHYTVKTLLNVQLIPLQVAILDELWHRPFPMLIGSRGLSKTFMMAVYAMLRATLCQGSRIVIVGAGFRQAKHVFEYCDTIWQNAPLLRDLANSGDNRHYQGPKRDVDRCRFRIGDSLITALPVGTGEKIRGERAHYTIADEFAAQNKEIFETVIAGFGVVSSSPVEQVKRVAKIKAMQKLGLPYDEEDNPMKKKGRFNQLVLSGTAYYKFNHFAEYHERYRKIINSRGNIEKLREIFPNGVPDNFNYRDYSVIRIPYSLIPEGFMEEKQVSRSKATMHSGTFNMEYGAVFTSDSTGFFRRSLIESCVTNEPIHLPSGSVHFRPATKGNSDYRYIYGIDPASEQDNFSIVLLEIHSDHRRIVYSWTTTRQHHKTKVKNKIVTETDFYGYCARKIRNLMKAFPCEKIGLDSQGGGVAVMEALHDLSRLSDGELPIWPTIDENKAKDTDDESGLHIVELINFAKAEWVSEANHGLRKDFEDKVLLFPFFDAVQIAEAIEDDKKYQRIHDTLEDCVFEIEELKDELSTIVHTQTANGRDQWNTPEIKLQQGKKGRMRKDRYSALLMANMVARSHTGQSNVFNNYESVGGVAGKTKQYGGGNLYIGPSWFTQGGNSPSSMGKVVRRCIE